MIKLRMKDMISSIPSSHSKWQSYNSNLGPLPHPDYIYGFPELGLSPGARSYPSLVDMSIHVSILRFFSLCMDRLRLIDVL